MRTPQSSGFPVDECQTKLPRTFRGSFLCLRVFDRTGSGPEAGAGDRRPVVHPHLREQPAGGGVDPRAVRPVEGGAGFLPHYSTNDILLGSGLEWDLGPASPPPYASKSRSLNISSGL